jgi:eukaryotic-like serine/threonine-protein kinase
MARKAPILSSIKALFRRKRRASEGFNCRAFPDNLGVLSPIAIHPQIKTGATQMTSDRWNKIKELFSSAQECAEDERSEFLARACEGDEELRSEVEKLLAASHENDSFLLDSAAAEFAGLFDFEDDENGFAPSLKSPPRFATGTIFNDRYHIEGILGRGGMGEVYLAADTRINRRVALKVLHSDLVSSKESLRRFGLETQAVSALNHPHIMTIYEFDRTDDGTVFFVAEYVDGKTLNRLIGAELRTETALDIAIQVCSALSAAHEAGITHRDIKPENVMVRRDGYVKVLDFGLAKLTAPRSSETSGGSGSEDPTRALNKTKPGQVMGTASYMSPEQARGLHVDARTDIWSVGAVVYEMLTGKRPFTGETEADVIVAVLLSEPAPISSFNAGVPNELEWIVTKSLAKDADARYQTAKELRADLEKIKKRIHFDEENVRISRPGPEDDRERTKLHSTAGGAVPTADGEVKRTSDGREGEPSFLSSPSLQSAFQSAQRHKLGTAAGSLIVVAALLAVGYYSFVARSPGPEIDSIAVLPFENLKGDADVNYLADGVSEALIDRLAQMPHLKVTSRNSSFKFRSSNLDLRDVASQLGVRAIVTGTVNQTGDDLIVRVEVVDAVENTHLSGGQYTRKSGDLIRIQDDIAKAAFEPLRSKLTNQQSQRLSDNPTENSEAYRYYLSGLVELNGPQGPHGRATLDYFERAVQLDPNFAAAFAEIGWIYWARANNSDDPNKLVPQARAAVDRALAIDPDLAKAHTVQAMMHEFEFDWSNAEQEYKRAIELSPNLDFARNNYAFFLSVMGRNDEALAQLAEQGARDPINRRFLLLQRGIVLTQARKFDDALRAYQDAQAVEPTREIPSFTLGYAYAGKGLYDEASVYYKKSVDVLGGEDKYSQPLVYLAAAYAKIPAKRTAARDLLTKIEGMGSNVSPALLAMVYSALDDNDTAMELLEKAYIKRDLFLKFIGCGYEYDDVRSDPRFVDLTRRMGLADFSR